MVNVLASKHEAVPRLAARSYDDLSMLAQQSARIGLESLTGIESQYAHYLGGTAVNRAGVVLANNFRDESLRAEQRNEEVIANFAPTSAKTPELWRDKSLLSERLERSAHGDEIAKASIDTDVFTEMTEQVCKAGGVLRVQARINDTGEIEQFGATTYSRQKNTLQTYSLSKTLRKTIYAEGQNGFLLEELHRTGKLAGKRAVEFSLIPDDTRAALAKHGYYLREVIGIIRVTTITSDGNCEIVSVLVGGTDQEKLPAFRQGMTERDERLIEERAVANRFDIKVMRRMYELFGVEGVENMTPTEFLALPVIIPDTFDHLDVAQLFDAVVSELHGNTRHYFFGLTTLRDAAGRPTRADYVAHEQKSRALQSKLKRLSADVSRELIARRQEARSDIEASQLMREIAKNHAIRHLVRDKTLDNKVYGMKTYLLTNEARIKWTAGDFYAAQLYTKQAEVAARPTGCPSPENASKLTKFGKDLMNNIKNKLELDDKLKEQSDEESYEFDVEMYCLECQALPDDGEAMKMCGPCGFCEQRDTEMRKKNGSGPKAA